jgi:hypothetical protein
MRPRTASWVLLFASLVLTGCGTGTPPLVAVTGHVSYHGQPLPGGVIVFAPDSAKGSNGPVASAVIQPDGSFTLRTADSPGAAVGWHRVTVVCVSDPDPDVTGSRYAVPVSLIPEKYRSADLSGLSREVRGGQTNEINLNLD